MTLIECPECRQQVSDTAAACPHCGYAIQNYLLASPPTVMASNAVSAPPGTERLGASPVIFRPLSAGLTGTTAGFWWATCAAYVIVAVFYFGTWGMWLSYVDEDALVWELIESEDVAFGFLGFATLLTWVSGILFIVWLYQAYKSAESLGGIGRRWSAGWTIGSWFIPLANLVLPKLVVNEVDRMSNPMAGDPPIELRWQSMRRLLPSDFWWITLISGQVLSFIGWMVYSSGPTYEDSLTGASYLVISLSAALFAAAAALAGVVAFIIGRRMRADRLA